MRSVWQRVGQFGRKRNRQDQLRYLGEMYDRFCDNPRIVRILERVASSPRLFASYDAGHRGLPEIRKDLGRLPDNIPDREPSEPGRDALGEVEAILGSLNKRDRLLVCMAFGIGRKRLKRCQIARKLGVTIATFRRRLRAILATVRIRADH